MKIVLLPREISRIIFQHWTFPRFELELPGAAIDLGVPLMHTRNRISLFYTTLSRNKANFPRIVKLIFHSDDLHFSGEVFFLNVCILFSMKFWNDSFEFLMVNRFWNPFSEGYSFLWDWKLNFHDIISCFSEVSDQVDASNVVRLLGISSYLWFTFYLRLSCSKLSL